MATTPEEPSSRLTSLPHELFDMIADYLDHEDLRSLRCVEKIHDKNPAILKRLFSCVRLSSLKRDLQGFMALSQRPYLAEHVQCITWIAFPDTVDTFFSCIAYAQKPVYDMGTLSQLFDAECWIGLNISDPALVTLLTAMISDFQKALAKLPRLTALQIRRPTPKETAQVLGGLGVLENRVSWSVRNGTLGRKHDTVFEFLHYVVQSHFTTAGHDVESSAIFSLPGAHGPTRDLSPLGTIYFYNPLISWAEDLKALVLETASFTPQQTIMACSILSRMVNLRCLVLCTSHNNDTKNEGNNHIPASSSLLIQAFLDRRACWPQLSHLALVDATMPFDKVKRLIAAHTSTLRTLFLQTPFRVADLQDLASIPNIALRQLVIRPTHVDAETVILSPTDALSFVNHCTPRAKTQRARRKVLINRLSRHHRDSPVFIRYRHDLAPEWGRYIGGIYDYKPGDYKNHYIRKCTPLKSYRFGAISESRRWKWGRIHAGGTVYAWESQDGTGSPTVMWKFRHDGQVLQSHTPFKKWPHWDDEKPGYTTEPLPWCHEFRVFIDQLTHSLGDAYVGGKLVIPPGTPGYGANDLMSARGSLLDAWADKRVQAGFVSFITSASVMEQRRRTWTHV